MFIKRIVCIVMLAQGHPSFGMDFFRDTTPSPDERFFELQIANAEQEPNDDIPKNSCVHLSPLSFPLAIPEAAPAQPIATQPIALPAKDTPNAHKSNDNRAELATALVDGCYVCNLIHPECKYTVPSMSHFSSHLEKHDNDAYSHICDTCNQRCETEEKLKTHCYTLHGRPKPLYTCVHPDCRFEHRKIAIMQEHINYKHNPINYPYICTYCDQRLKNQHGLTTHINTAHIGKDIVIEMINARGIRTTISRRLSNLKNAAAAAKAANLTHSRE